MSLSNVIATKRFSVERSTRDEEFSGCDADEILATYRNVRNGGKNGRLFTI